MANLAAFPLNLDVKKRTCSVIIETPKGRRNSSITVPNRTSFAWAACYPKAWPFLLTSASRLPRAATTAILMDEPAHVGCLLDVGIVGATEAEQTQDGFTETNDRLLAVAIHSDDRASRYRGI